MNIFKKEQESVKIIRPPVLGWIEKKLSDKEMDYLWKCVDNRKESYKKYLAGNIHESNKLADKSDWFFRNTLAPMCKLYSEEFQNIGENIPVNQKHPYYLKNFWVNYQKQNEFNPLHDHTGVYSFVVWMKIPTNHDEQNKNPISLKANTRVISTFQFSYLNIIGNRKTYNYQMNPEVEGTLVFFPANLDHQVYPFYNCDEERISISGNISLNSTKLL